MENEHIVLTHLSRRTELKIARKLVRDKLPPETAAKITFLMGRRRQPAQSITPEE